MKTGQPLSDIAYACGFRDYTYLRADSASASAPRRAPSEQGAPGNDNARARADIGKVRRILKRAGKGKPPVAGDEIA